MFGLGYIGYMTFVVTLLREQGLAGAQIVAFYVLLGAGVVASSWIWAGLLQRFRGGESLALLNALLALATLLPVLSAHPVVVFASGALFGSVFLSLVASTTALVRHNLPPAAWPGGIAAFTIVFAAGQIVGPSAVGWVADGPGGLARGFVVLGGGAGARRAAGLAAEAAGCGVTAAFTVTPSTEARASSPSVARRFVLSPASPRKRRMRSSSASSSRRKAASRGARPAT